jgi:flagellin
MVALQTLKSVNKNLGMVQNEISTGKSIATAKDNASVWAIAKTMESDVKGFSGINDALANGSANVAVARNAAETITDLLGQIKEKVVAAQDPAGDATKLNTDVTALRNQIDSVISAAQFNGVNLVDGNTASINILSSLDRASDGTVNASNIQVTGVDLSTTAAATLGAATFADSGAGAPTWQIADNAGAGVATASVSIVNNAAELTLGANLAAGNVLSFDITGIDGNTTSISYTVTQGDQDATSTATVVASNLASLINAEGITDLEVDLDVTDPDELVFTSGGAGAPFTIIATARAAGNTNLGDLRTITDGNIGTAATLEMVETLITRSIDAAAALGSSQGRIETQQSFVNNLTDSLKTGIGALVDADMEEASARLQALQVQQQLAVQSLSIANQSPQSILSLFR